jgi:hypothetical protein
MSTTWKMILVAAVYFGIAASLLTANEPKSEAKAENKLIGSWKLVSGKYSGKEYKFPEGSTMVKHITPTQFMWATYDKDGKVTRAAGGSYTLKGDDYVETPEYGISSDFDIIKGNSHEFKWKIDGNKWHHDGKLKNGVTIEEVWERIESK